MNVHGNLLTLFTRSAFWHVIILAATAIAPLSQSLAGVIHQFSQVEGSGPAGGLILASDKRLYGTTLSGGNANLGVVYGVGRDGGSFTVLHQFQGGATDGREPYATLLESNGGYLFGTTYSGGGGMHGILFRLRRDGSEYEILHQFGAGTDGANLFSGVVQGPDGLLYGFTLNGGVSGKGTLFRIHPDGGDYVILHQFQGGVSGGHPFAAPTIGTDGRIYGSTAAYGAHGFGNIFRVERDGSNFVVLHDFAGGTADGSTPYASLVETCDGHFYGTTHAGGSFGLGTIFRIDAALSYSLVHSFDYHTGQNPNAGVVHGANGTLYGTTYWGGAEGHGVVYELSSSSGALSVLQSFAEDSVNGTHSTGAPVVSEDGSLYLITAGGGQGFGAIVAQIVAPVAPARTYDLAQDWSDAADCYSPWRYRKGERDLPLIQWTPTQLAYADAPVPMTGHVPVIFRLTNHSPGVSNLEPGDIAIHSNDQSGNGPGEGNVAWVSPGDGTIDVDGSVWWGGGFPERANEWRVYFNNALLSSGHIGASSPYSRLNPFRFVDGSGGVCPMRRISVRQGDIVRFELVNAAGSPAGMICGVNMQVRFAPLAPSIQQFHLRTEFSDANNPNGEWIYRKGVTPLTNMTWLGTQKAYVMASAPQVGHAPSIFQLSRHEGGVSDLLPGDIGMHSWDANFGGEYAEGIIVWKSPGNGLVNIVGNAWWGGDEFAGRHNQWTLSQNETLLTGGHLYHGDPYSRSHPMEFSEGSGGPCAMRDLTVAAGDEIRLSVITAPGSPAGMICGLNMEVRFLPRPVAVPEIVWNLPNPITYGMPMPFSAGAPAAVDPDSGLTVNGTFSYDPPLGTILHAGAGSEVSVTFTPNSPLYAMTSRTFTVDVAPAPLTVTADNKVMLAGQPLPPFTAAYSGFVNNDTAAILTGTLGFYTSATESSPVGVYPIVVGGVSAPGDYSVTFQPGILRVVASSFRGEDVYDFEHLGLEGLIGQDGWFKLGNESWNKNGWIYQDAGGPGSGKYLGPFPNRNGVMGRMNDVAWTYDIPEDVNSFSFEFDAKNLDGGGHWIEENGTWWETYLLQVGLLGQTSLPFAIGFTGRDNLDSFAIWTGAGEYRAEASTLSRGEVWHLKAAVDLIAGTVSLFAQNLTQGSGLDPVAGLKNIPLGNVARAEFGGLFVRLQTGRASPFIDNLRVTKYWFAPSDPPNIVTQPESIHLQPNETGTLSVSCTGADPLVYQWFHNGQPVDGAKQSTLTFEYATTADAGTYSVRIDNSYGFAISQPVTVRVGVQTPSVVWLNPPDITYGTPLGESQLNAVFQDPTTGYEVPGTAVYTPPVGTILNAATSQSLSVAFTPTDPVAYTTASGSVLISVLKATPGLSWPDPAAILFGTALSGVQLNAVATVPGDFNYVPPAGTVLAPGNGQLLTADFTPQDTANYHSASVSTTIDVKLTETVIVHLEDSAGNPIAGGRALYYAGVWNEIGLTGTDGTVAIELAPGTYPFRVEFAHGTNQKSQNVTADPHVTFQTRRITVALRDSGSIPLPGAPVQYYGGAWRDLGLTAADGTVSVELLPGSYPFRIEYASATDQKTQNIVSDPNVNFETLRTSVRLEDSLGNPLSGANAHYYSGVWRSMGLTGADGIAAIELLPGSFPFRVEYGSVTNQKTQDTTSDPNVVFQTKRTSVRLTDSFGNPLTGAKAQYFSGAWREMGFTGADGSAAIELLPGTFPFRIEYAWAANQKSQNTASDPNVVFQTKRAVVRLTDSAGNPLAGGKTQYYSGTWRDIGVTAADGNAAIELLPNSYPFNMEYAYGKVQRTQNISSDTSVLFETGTVHSGTGTCIQYYGTGAWRTFVNGMDLMPTSFTFRFNDGTPNSSAAITAGVVNNIH